jgi:LacI family transcriptional regulator
MKRAPRIRLVDIAAACGVSKASVVQALNRPSETCELAPATRERIRAAAARLGYRPDWRARALGGARTNTIGLLYPGWYPPMGGYPCRLLGACARFLAERGYALLLQRCWEQATWRETLAERRVDGVLLISEAPDGMLAEERFAMPVVAVNLQAPGAVPQVLPDDRGGAHLAVRHLLATGHRRIAYVARVDLHQHFSRAARQDGYLDAMRQAGASAQVLSGIHGLTQALHHDQRPTAVLAYDDRLAIEAMQTAMALGLHVPHDLSVIGCNDEQEASIAAPPLTSIRLPTDPLGRAAADLILDLLAGGEAPGGPLLLPEELVLRASTA